LISKAESNLKVKQILPGLIKIIQDIGGEAIITGIENQAQLDIAIETGAKYYKALFWAKQLAQKTCSPTNSLANPN